MNDYPQLWVTNEKPPRAIIVKGRSGIDWDCLVAYYEEDTERSNPLWIVEHSGYVCDKHNDSGNKVYATQVRARSDR